MTAAALLTSAGPTARLRDTDRGSQQTRDLDRLLTLMAPLAKAVLESPDPEDFDANLDEQLFSGLFSDLIGKSMQAMVQRRGEVVAVELDEQFLTEIKGLGGDRAKAERALKLSQISTRLTLALVPVLLEDAPDVQNIDIPVRVNLSDILYDIAIPVEVREAVHADCESAICLITLAYAITNGTNLPQWLVTELVERWLAGQVKWVPVLLASVGEQGIDSGDHLSDELRIRLDELLEAREVPDLHGAQERADAIHAQMCTIAEHASRQIGDVWPKPEDA